MKPSKKLIKQTPKKNQVATGIETFFKSAPKDFIVEEKVAEINPNNGAKKFFVDVLKERLQSKNTFFILCLGTILISIRGAQGRNYNY